MSEGDSVHIRKISNGFISSKSSDGPMFKSVEKYHESNPMESTGQLASDGDKPMMKKSAKKKEVKGTDEKPKKWIGAMNGGKGPKKGALHQEMGIPESKKIPTKKLDAAAKKPGKLGKLGKRARLAKAFKKMK